MAYKRGEFLRMHFTCKASADSVKLHIGAHEGSYRPWWSELQVEILRLELQARLSSRGWQGGPGSDRSRSRTSYGERHYP